jgi:hypothetical protein
MIYLMQLELIYLYSKPLPVEDMTKFLIKQDNAIKAKLIPMLLEDAG